MHMTINERVYLTKTALARAAKLDSRDKELKDFEPDACLISAKDKRIALYAAALADVLKSKQGKH